MLSADDILRVGRPTLAWSSRWRVGLAIGQASVVPSQLAGPPSVHSWWRCLTINDFNSEYILEESGGAMVAVQDCFPPAAKVANNDADEGKAPMPPPSANWLVCKKLKRKATMENH
ncbi:MAG: hypothetical protein Q9198_005745 [Flavoplaca austrocitrina]